MTHAFHVDLWRSAGVILSTRGQTFLTTVSASYMSRHSDHDTDSVEFSTTEDVFRRLFSCGRPVVWLRRSRRVCILLPMWFDSLEVDRVWSLAGARPSLSVTLLCEWHVYPVSCDDSVNGLRRQASMDDPQPLRVRTASSRPRAMLCRRDGWGWKVVGSWD